VYVNHATNQDMPHMQEGVQGSAFVEERAQLQEVSGHQKWQAVQV